MTNQGKLLMKHEVPWFFVFLELTLALPWSIEINGSKISFYCVKMSRVKKSKRHLFEQKLTFCGPIKWWKYVYPYKELKKIKSSKHSFFRLFFLSLLMVLRKNLTADNWSAKMNNCHHLKTQFQEFLARITPSLLRFLIASLVARKKSMEVNYL